MIAETVCIPCEPERDDIDQACDDSVVIDLVASARDGDAQAWGALVERYAPLIWSICRKYRLDRADADDVSQSVWLHLVDHLGKIREPAALAGWLATTTRRECGRLVRTAHADRTQSCTRSTPRIWRMRTPTWPSRKCLRPSATRRCARRTPIYPRNASGWSLCSPPTRRYRTPRSAPRWPCPSAALARPVAAAWTGCAATQPSLR